MNQRIAHHQSAGQGMKKGSFCLTGAGQRESCEFRRGANDLPLCFRDQPTTGAVVIAIGEHNEDRGGGEGGVLWPIDRIEEDCPLL
jgi:hypothetical protein